MTETTTNKLAINVTNSWKMYSQRFLALFSLAVSGGLTWFFALPEDCGPLLAKGLECARSQHSTLAEVFGRFGWSIVAVPAVGFAVQWIYRVWPQINLALAEAEAKSAGAPQAAVEVPAAVAAAAEAIRPDEGTTKE